MGLEMLSEQELEILRATIYKEFEMNNKALFETNFAKYCHEQFAYYLQSIDKYKNKDAKIIRKFIERLSKPQN
ncbi:MAG: hypothetical protein WC475_03220 [Candidatus Paceibacterota bacterium]